MLYIWMGRAKTGKSSRVLETIRTLGDNGKQILLVPEHASHQAEIDLCRVCGDTASRHAEVLSFRRLGDRALARTGGAADISLDAGGKLLTLQRCVTELAPSLNVYRRPSRKPAFLIQLLDLFDELRAYEISPEMLSGKAETLTGSTGEKLRDLGLLYAAYETRLHRDGHDLRDHMSKLCDNLAASEYVKDKDIFLDGFSYFNGQERKILSVMLRQARSVTITLLGEPDSREEIFAPARKTLWQLKRLSEDAAAEMQVETMRSEPAGPLGHLERYFFGDIRPYDGNVSGVIRLRETESILHEVEQAAAEIIHLVSSGKARFRDITVSARNMQDYEGSIESVFTRWEIPAYLNRRTDILEKPVVCLLTGILSAVTDGYEYEDMFRWLKTGLAGLTPEECDRLENYVLRWEIHGQMWLRESDWTEHPEGYGAEWSDEHTARLAEINALRQRVREPLFELSESLKSGETGREKAEALYNFLERLNLRESLETRMREQSEAGRLQDAEETAQLWDILCGILDQFAELLGDESMDTETFSKLFRQALNGYSIGTVPVSLDQVAVSEITRNDRHTVQYLFLLGANDHVLPAAGQSGGILNRTDRELLAQAGMELSPTGMEQMAVELQILYAALVQPVKGLYISWPISDGAGTWLRPAFVVERIRTLFPALQIEQERLDKSWRLTAKLPALEMAGSMQDKALREYFANNPEYSDRLAAMDRAAVLKRGSLSRKAVRMLYGRRQNLSASRLERMRSCHFAYFMQYGLKAKSRKAAVFDAPQIGTFLHYLLEHVLREVMELSADWTETPSDTTNPAENLSGMTEAVNPSGAAEDVSISDAAEDADMSGRGKRVRPDAEFLRERTDFYTEQFIRETFGDMSEKSARFRYLFLRLRRNARNIVAEAVEELLESDFVPLAFELTFGDGQKFPAVVISQPDGELRLGGRVDRVDGWVRNGKLYLRVVDYKSGRKTFDLSAVRMGLNLQMLVYMFALEDNGQNRFGQPAEAAGVLYVPARNSILNAARNISPTELDKMRQKELRRSGLVLSDPDVLQAMEHDALTEPHYLPVRIGKDGTIQGALATAEQFGKLRRYLDKLLRQIGTELRQGCIDADPCCKSPEDAPCTYCEWADACHFRDGHDTDRYRWITPVAQDAFWAEVDQAVSDSIKHVDQAVSDSTKHVDQAVSDSTKHNVSGRGV